MRRSRHARFRWLLSAILLLATVACEPPPPPEAEALTECVWWGMQPEGLLHDQHAFEFTLGDDGLQGVLHFLSAGKQVSEIPLHDVRFRPPAIAFHAGAIALEGRVDIDGGTLEVESVNRRGPWMKADAERRDPATVPGLAVWRSAAGETTYRYRQPPEAGDGWPTATPEDVGLERATLEAMVDDVIAGEAGLLHSLLVVQGDRLVLEEYFHGHEMDDLHLIASCTKSIASLLIGLALDQGLIPGVESPVLAYFPARAADAAEGWSSVKLMHLLNMTVGLGLTQRELMSGRVAGIRSGGNGPGGFRSLLTRELVHEPGTRWNYSSPDINLLGGILHQATGMQADTLAEGQLFAPLGIRTYDWSSFGKVDGYPNLAGSLWLRPRGMAKIGILVLNEGRWGEDQLISSKWIRSSCSPRADTRDGDYGYGYLWWLMNLPDGERIIQARGWGSQFILIDAKTRRVIVTTGGNEANGKTFDILRILLRHLYPED